MNLHFAGADNGAAYNEILLRCGAKYRLESYHSLKPKEPSSGFTLLLDSGGFVARTKGIPIDVKEYARYIRKHKVTMAFELDTNNLAETLYNRQYLMTETEAKIIPVYHYSDYQTKDYKMLFEFMDKFDYISIGGVAGEGLGDKEERLLYDFVFSNTRDKVRVHGLGITALPILKRYPFYSVDSTSWLSAARFGNFRSIRDENHEEWRRKNRHYLANTDQEVQHWLQLEKYVTDLWTEKGITWTAHQPA